MQGAYEYCLVLLSVTAAVGLVGPGTYSLDHWLGIALPQLLSKHPQSTEQLHTLDKRWIHRL